MSTNSALRLRIAKRAHCKDLVRTLLSQRGYLEVDPCGIRSTACIDPFIDLFSLQNSSFYLQSSPELAMKHLLCEGSGAIFYLGSAWRAKECGEKHAPEFTLIEWYCTDEERQKHTSTTALEEELQRDLAKKLGDLQLSQLALEAALLCSQVIGLAEESLTGMRAYSFSELLQEISSIKIDQPSDKLYHQFLKALEEAGCSYDLPYAPSPQELPLLLSRACSLWADRLLQPWLKANRSHCGALTLLYDFVTFHQEGADSALAQTKPLREGFRLAQRFEIYQGEVELANGYRELLDGEEMRARQQEALTIKKIELKGPQPALDLKLIEQLKAAKLPPCCGVAVGFDRLMQQHFLHSRSKPIQESTLDSSFESHTATAHKVTSEESAHLAVPISYVRLDR